MKLKSKSPEKFEVGQVWGKLPATMLDSDAVIVILLAGAPEPGGYRPQGLFPYRCRIVNGDVRVTGLSPWCRMPDAPDHLWSFIGVVEEAS